MSWFSKAVSAADKATSSVISTTSSAVSTTSSAVSSSRNVISNAIHNPGKENDSNYDYLDLIPSFYSVRRGGLKFKFASSKGKVLIYAHESNTQIQLLEFDNIGAVMSRVRAADYRYVPYKEHIIKYHTYTEIITFVKKYISNNRAHSLNPKRREFAIRLAEFCGVSIDELDGQCTLGIKAASQLYTVNDTVKEVSKGIKTIVMDQKPISGTGHIIGSVAQNTVKFGIATVKSAANQNVSSVPNAMSDAFHGRHRDDEKYIASNENTHIQYNYNTNNDHGVTTNNPVIGGNIEGDDCPICYANGKSHAMQCGHILCWDCVQKVDECPFCKVKKKNVVKLFNLKDDD
eukprot:465110_1